MPKELKITSKQKKAIALEYKQLVDLAPKVTAKGRGLIAEKIIQLAKDSGVPIHEDADLVEVLSALDIEELIPPELYQIVAQVLAFVYAMNNKYRNSLAK